MLKEFLAELRERVGKRAYQIFELSIVKRLRNVNIACRLQVNRTTVSRTIRRVLKVARKLATLSPYNGDPTFSRMIAGRKLRAT